MQLVRLLTISTWNAKVRAKGCEMRRKHPQGRRRRNRMQTQQLQRDLSSDFQQRCRAQKLTAGLFGLYVLEAELKSRSRWESEPGIEGS